MLTRDQLIAALKKRRRTQEEAEAQADAAITKQAERDATRAAAKSACDYANSLKWKPGTPHPGPPVWNATRKRWERSSS